MRSCFVIAEGLQFVKNSTDGSYDFLGHRRAVVFMQEV